MPQIGPYQVSSTNGSKVQQAAIRVKRNGVHLADVKCEHSAPLRWVQTRLQSKERKQLVEQLIMNNVPLIDIEMILTPPPKPPRKVRAKKSDGGAA